MRRSEARVALEAARRWNERGMFKPGAFERLEGELVVVAREDEPGLAMQAFYAVGGLMLGAATAALFGLLRLEGALGSSDPAAWGFFAACAIALLGTGAALLLAGQRDLGDALLLAGVVPAAVTLGPTPPAEVLWLLPTLVGLGLVAARNRGYILPIVGLALALASLPFVLYRSLPEEPASLWWLLCAGAAWAGAVTWNRASPPAWDDEASASATLALAAAWLGVTIHVVQPGFDAGHEVVLGVFLLALLGVGVLLRQRGAVFAAAAALTVDAIVFAFDLGGPTTGLVVLLLIAGGLITTATLLRRRRARAEPS